MTGNRNNVTVVAMLLAAVLAAVAVHAIEQPKFDIVEQVGDVEIRKYPRHLVARTLITGPIKEAGDQGFRRLAGYIFGGNTEGEKIAMTAPVTVEPYTPSSASRYWISFKMPAAYDRSELPTPDDDRVDIAELPTRHLAVLRYKGGWSETRYRKHEAMLLSQLDEMVGWTKHGAPSWARYDPPFMPWFMRTNEVAIEVVPADPANLAVE